MDPFHRRGDDFANWEKKGRMSNQFEILNSRVTDNVKRSLMRYHASLLGRLSPKKMLKAEVCNNTLTWNYNGSCLMSGGNDVLRIWGYPATYLLYEFSAGEDSNGIMSARFIADKPERVVSGSGSGQVRVFDINRNHQSLASFECHEESVKGVAVVNGEPEVIWSASEDGTVRVHDMREASQCDVNTCNKVQLDLGNAHLDSLGERPSGLFSINSFDINPMRPTSILIGGTDSFARLYDTRIESLTSTANNNGPPSCIQYYCPKHLCKRAADGQMTYRRGKEITHVSFKSDGLEALINYFGDHIYLLNIKQEGLKKVVDKEYGERLKNVVDAHEPEEYDSDSISRMTQFSSYREYYIRYGGDEQLQACFKKVRDDLKREVSELNNPYQAIERLTSYLTLPYSKTFETYELLCTRASLFLQRNWYKDFYMALRDCYAARVLGHSDYKLFYTLAEVLLQMDEFNALECAYFAHLRNPSNLDVERRLNDTRIKVEEISKTKAEFKKKYTAVASKYETYSSSEELEEELDEWDPVDTAFDMRQRYLGHINFGTRTKEANFIDREGEYIVSGSDDGMFYIYEKRSGKLMSRYLGHRYAVTCIQCHPTELAIATCGFGMIGPGDHLAMASSRITEITPNNEVVEDLIKIWTPDAIENNCLTRNDFADIEVNQGKLGDGSMWHILPEVIRSQIQRDGEI